MKTDSGVQVIPFQPAAVLLVIGADAAAFLQGQFTQELRQGGERAVRYGLWLNHKGKVLADSFALRETAERWWLVSYFSRAAVIKERLESYIIADDVNVEDMSAGWKGLVVTGSGAELWLGSRFGKVPSPGAFENGTGVVFHGRRGVPAFEWLVPADVGPPVQGVGLGTAEDLERWRIENAVPAVGRDLGAGDLPNEAGLDADAVSYTKGCYLGQEVMARLKSMGQVRRGLIRVHGSGAAPSVLPAALYVGEKRVGELRSAIDVDAGFIGLAMVSLMGVDASVGLRVEGSTEASIYLNPKTS